MRPRPVAIEPTPEAAAPAQPAPVKPPPSRTVVEYRLDPLKSWPVLYMTEAELAGGEPAVEAGGLVATREEFEAFSRGLDPAAAQEALRTDLLLLAYLRDQRALSDPAFQAEARARLRRELAQLALERFDRGAVAVTRDEAYARYQAGIDRYRQPPLATVRLILVSTASEAEALRDRLQSGEAFDALARQFSQHPSRDRGGDLDPFPPGTFSEALDEEIFSMAPGTLATVTTSRGVFLIQKLSETAPAVIPFDTVRPEIEETLRREKREAARRAFLERLETADS
jgi:parvulin-like peptidyl-prolyl isomerase